MISMCLHATEIYGKQSQKREMLSNKASSLLTGAQKMVSGQKTPRQKPLGQKPLLPKAPQTIAPQRKLMNTKYILHK